MYSVAVAGVWSMKNFIAVRDRGRASECMCICPFTATNWPYRMLFGCDAFSSGWHFWWLTRPKWEQRSNLYSSLFLAKKKIYYSLHLGCCARNFITVMVVVQHAPCSMLALIAFHIHSIRAKKMRDLFFCVLEEIIKCNMKPPPHIPGQQWIDQGLFSEPEQIQ